VERPAVVFPPRQVIPKCLEMNRLRM
jgi:hypothetical protein